MRLADHFLAACGSLADLGSFASLMAPVIRQAQRFEIADEVATAVHGLVDSRPSTLAAALPLCRLPYSTMWLEWRGGLGPRQRPDGPPVPTRQGALIQSIQGQVGFMTFGWIHHEGSDAENDALGIEHQVNISPIAIYFDWRRDGNVSECIRMMHDSISDTIGKAEIVRACFDSYRENFERRYLKTKAWDSGSALQFFTKSRPSWAKLADSKRELEALEELDRHLGAGLSPHGVGMIATVMQVTMERNAADTFRHFVTGWERDVQSEGTFVECFLAMLNSRNPVVEHTTPDLTKLNKHRVRKGKAPFLPYNKTRLAMSRSQANVARARGIDHETARLHLVRGHFKIRRTGVYWWSDFWRGDPTKGGVERREYDVVE